MTAFVDFIWYLEYIGVARVLLPFFLVFTVIFAVLQKSKILGEDAKRYNTLLSLAMGLAVVFPHVLGAYPPGMDVVVIINQALPQVAVFIIGAIMLLLMLGVFGIGWPGDNDSGAGSLIVMASLAIIVYIFVSSANVMPYGLPWWLIDPQTQAMLVTLLVFGVVIWFITREESDSSNEGPGFSERYFSPVKLKED